MCSEGIYKRAYRHTHTHTHTHTHKPADGRLAPESARKSGELGSTAHNVFSVECVLYTVSSSFAWEYIGLFCSCIGVLYNVPSCFACFHHVPRFARWCNIYIYIYMHMCVFVCVCVCVCVCILLIYVCIYIYKRMCVCVWVGGWVSSRFVWFHLVQVQGHVL
jgi:hypothetical protein